MGGKVSIYSLEDWMLLPVEVSDLPERPGVRVAVIETFYKLLVQSPGLRSRSKWGPINFVLCIWPAKQSNFRPFQQVQESIKADRWVSSAKLAHVEDYTSFSKLM